MGENTLGRGQLCEHEDRLILGPIPEHVYPQLPELPPPPLHLGGLDTWRRRIPPPPVIGFHAEDEIRAAETIKNY